METLKEILKIESLLQKPNLDKALINLAEVLMNEYCIDNGKYYYFPIEIEFYIYDKKSHPDRHVYPRDNKSACELFFHYSGMDICFYSSFMNGRFGGILIRALERINKSDNSKQLIGGPLVCVNEVLNSAQNKCVLIHKTYPNAEKNQVEQFGQRVGIKKFQNLLDAENKSIEDEYYNKQYRFVRKDKINQTLERENVSYDFKNQTQTNPCKSKRKYKIEKFQPKE